MSSQSEFYGVTNPGQKPDQIRQPKNTAIECMGGHMFDPVNPTPSTVRLSDIAKGLAWKARYAGLYDGDHWYAISQHCVIGAREILNRYGCEELALKFMLHDAAEAFLQDISSPLKPVLPDYNRLENNLLGVIYESFGLSVSDEEWELIHAMDRELYLREIVEFGIHKSRHKDSPGNLSELSHYYCPQERIPARDDYLSLFKYLSRRLVDEYLDITEWMECEG